MSFRYLFRECYDYLWQEPILNFDGSLIGCCHNYSQLFCNSDNNFQSLDKILNNTNVVNLRKDLLTNNIENIMNNPNYPCKECYIFKNNLNDIKQLKQYNLKGQFDFFKKIIPSNLINHYSNINIELLDNIRVEIDSNCQLKCPACWRAFYIPHKTLNIGRITFDNFKNIINQLPSLKTIHLTHNGESLLHPQFADMLYMCKERNITPTCYSGFNFNHISTEQLLALIKCGCYTVTLSIDGASQETYSQYRIGGNFEKVIENIKKLVRLKEIYNSSLPNVIWKFIVFSYNIHEIDKAFEISQILGINFSLAFNAARNFDKLSESQQKLMDEKILQYNQMVIKAEQVVRV